MNGLQVPLAVVGAWVTLMALIVARRRRAQKGRDRQSRKPERL